MDIKHLSSLIDESRKPLKIYLKKNGRKILTCIEGLSKDYLKDYKKVILVTVFTIIKDVSSQEQLDPVATQM